MEPITDDESVPQFDDTHFELQGARKVSPRTLAGANPALYQSERPVRKFAVGGKLMSPRRYSDAVESLPAYGMPPNSMAPNGMSSAVLSSRNLPLNGTSSSRQSSDELTGSFDGSSCSDGLSEIAEDGDFSERVLDDLEGDATDAEINELEIDEEIGFRCNRKLSGSAKSEVRMPESVVENVISRSLSERFEKVKSDLDRSDQGRYSLNDEHRSERNVKVNNEHRTLKQKIQLYEDREMAAAFSTNKDVNENGGSRRPNFSRSYSEAAPPYDPIQFVSKKGRKSLPLTDNNDVISPVEGDIKIQVQQTSPCTPTDLPNSSRVIDGKMLSPRLTARKSYAQADSPKIDRNRAGSNSFTKTAKRPKSPNKVVEAMNASDSNLKLAKILEHHSDTMTNEEFENMSKNIASANATGSHTNQNSTAVPKTTVPNVAAARDSTAVPKTTVPNVATARDSTAVPKTSNVAAARDSTAVPKTTVPNVAAARDSTAVPKTTVPNVAAARDSTAIPKTTVPNVAAARDSAAVPKTSNVAAARDSTVDNSSSYRKLNGKNDSVDSSSTSQNIGTCSQLSLSEDSTQYTISVGGQIKTNTPSTSTNIAEHGVTLATVSQGRNSPSVDQSSSLLDSSDKQVQVPKPNVPAANIVLPKENQDIVPTENIETSASPSGNKVSEIIATTVVPGPSKVPSGKKEVSAAADVASTSGASLDVPSSSNAANLAAESGTSRSRSSDVVERNLKLFDEKFGPANRVLLIKKSPCSTPKLQKKMVRLCGKCTHIINIYLKVVYA